MLILLCDEQKYCIILPMTRLPSNLTLTSHECMHLVMRGHFRSRDKDDGHTIRSATAKNHLLHANFMARCFIELQLLQTEVIHCRNRDFGPFLLLRLWLWPNDRHIQTWPIFPGEGLNVWTWTSYVKAFDSYHIRDIRCWNYIPRCFAGGQ